MTSQINPEYPVFGIPTTQSVRDNFTHAKAEIEALQAATVTMSSGDIWMPINAYYDGANWQRIDTSKYAFALVLLAFASIPGEEAFGGNSGFMFLRCTPGANPISSTWWTTGGWENALIVDQYRHLVVGGQGIEIDGAGGIPFGRVTHTADGTGNFRTGILSNMYVDFSNVDDVTSPSWFAGRKGDAFTVERAAAGGTTAASLTELLCISNAGAVSLTGGSIQSNGKAGTLFAGLNIAQPQQGFISWNAYQDTSNLWRSIAGGGVAYITANAGIITMNAANSSTAGNTVVPTQILQMGTLGITMGPSTDITLNRAPTNTLHAATKAYVDGQAAATTQNIGRNQLHNGLFRIAQRGFGPWTATGYTADRWAAGITTDTASLSVAGLSDADRTAIGDEDANAFLQNVFTGNAAAGAFNQVVQRIENVRRLANKTVTVSFWAKAASGTPKLGINIIQNFGTGGSPSTAVRALATGNAVTLSTTWARYTSTIAIPSAAGKTLGTNGDNSTALEFWFSSGSTNNLAAGNIGVQSGTISLWGVQLEIGSAATPLEKPDPAQDLAKCQRFYQTGTFALASYQGIASNGVGCWQPFAVVMRATPTMATSGVSTTNCTGALNPVTVMGFQPYATSTATGSLSYSGTFTASAEL